MHLGPLLGMCVLRRMCSRTECAVVEEEMTRPEEEAWPGE